MPAYDLIHNAVKNALIKDGWLITADPYVIVYDDVRLFADLAAERTLSAQQGSRRIVVEIKGFAGESPIHQFEQALGQYIFYRQMLSETAPEFEIYLAITDSTYHTVFQRAAIRLMVESQNVALVLVNVDREEIVQWIA